MFLAEAREPSCRATTQVFPASRDTVHLSGRQKTISNLQSGKSAILWIRCLCLLPFSLLKAIAILAVFLRHEKKPSKAVSSAETCMRRTTVISIPATCCVSRGSASLQTSEQESIEKRHANGESAKYKLLANCIDSLTNSFRRSDTHFSSFFLPQTLNGPFFVVPMPIPAVKHSLEIAWRDLRIP